ncbi:hypothetical protein MKX01_019700, partial [Papaver californicum]
MDSARSWFHKFQPRERLRQTSKKKDSIIGTGTECSKPPLGGGAAGGGGDDEAASNVTKQKVAAAKQYIENHYKEQMKNLQERKER